MKKLFFLSIMLFLIAAAIPVVPSKAKGPTSIGSTDIKINASDVASIKLSYYHACLGDCSSEYDYEFKKQGNILTDGEVTLPVSIIQPLLNGLHTLYPGTRPVEYKAWTDDYPDAWISLTLEDGRVINIQSTSQYARLIPWNILIWEEDENGTLQLTESFILLHEDIHKALSVVWQALTGYSFPRDLSPEEWLESWWFDSDTEPESLEMTYYMDFGNLVSAAQAEIYVLSPSIFAPYEPLLQENEELRKLSEAGFSLFDATFEIITSLETSRPIQYSGTIALRAPDSPDVIVTTASILLEPELLVTTPITAAEVERLIKERKSHPFLNTATSILPDITYLLDTREDIRKSPYDCPEASGFTNPSYAASGLLTEHNSTPFTFYYFEDENAWSIDLSAYLLEEKWSKTTIQKMLSTWFPNELSELNVDDLSAISTNFLIAYKPNITNHDPALIDLLQDNLPKESYIHIEHPQKEGDMTFATLEGRVIVPVDTHPPELIFCGYTRPEWYRPPYDVDSVSPPSPVATDYSFSISPPKSGWTKPYGLPKSVDFDHVVRSLAMTSGSPGMISMLWTNDDDGVYYAEGLANGTNWTEPQWLGPESWNVHIESNLKGDMHLLWSTHFSPIGTMHVWRPAGGKWQEPEYWEGIGYFSQVLLDENNELHLGFDTSDGLDEEHFYVHWDEKNGISEPENISRRIGDSGGGLAIKQDSKGLIHAVWGHPLSDSPYIDPLSGEIFDQVGLFYSQRQPDGTWSEQELIGSLGEYAYSFDFELNASDKPVVIWQGVDGIYSMTKDAAWTDPALLATAVTPEKPAPFGPDRWGAQTVELGLARNENGTLYAAWSILGEGVFLAKEKDNSWESPIMITEEDCGQFDIFVSKYGTVYLLLSMYSGRLTLAVVRHEEIDTTPMDIVFDYFMAPSKGQLIVDQAGFIYVLGSPRSPRWTVFLPEDVELPTPTPVPTATTTPTPTLAPTQLESLTASATPTYGTRSVTGVPDSLKDWLILVFIAAAILFVSIGVVRQNDRGVGQDESQDEQ